MKFLHEFSKYGDGTVSDNGWWQISEDGKRLLNGAGGWHDYIPSDDDIIAEADSWEDLDWSCLIMPDSPYGWIDREGKWYGCKYSDHASVANLVLHSSERALEMQGWIKVYRNFRGEVDWFFDCDLGAIRSRLTPAQVKTLEDHGIYEPWFDSIK